MKSAVFMEDSSLTHAVLCPAEDGGYGMLSVPPNVDALRVFPGVRWSQSLTALSQLKALSDAGIWTRMGRLMYDIDEPADVQALVKRLEENNSSATLQQNDALLCSSANPGDERTSDCPGTRKVLLDFGLTESDLEGTKPS